MRADILRIHALAARLEARLLATPLATLTPAASELMREALGRLAPVVRTLGAVIDHACAQDPA